jgi:hypothetical protein
MVECPNCGFKFPAKSRMGEGTQSMKDAKRLSKNDLYIFKMFVDGIFGHPVTIREIQKAIYDTPPAKAWNYHNIQLHASRLVGAGVLMMSNNPAIWLKFPETKSFAVDKTPRYWLSIDRGKALLIIAQDGLLR